MKMNFMSIRIHRFPIKFSNADVDTNKITLKASALTGKKYEVFMKVLP